MTLNNTTNNEGSKAFNPGVFSLLLSAVSRNENWFPQLKTFSCGNLNNILIKQQKNYSLCQSFVIKQATGNCFPSPYYYY